MRVARGEGEQEQEAERASHRGSVPTCARRCDDGHHVGHIDRPTSLRDGQARGGGT
jgi:hypothetical protein